MTPTECQAPSLPLPWGIGLRGGAWHVSYPFKGTSTLSPELIDLSLSGRAVLQVAFPTNATYPSRTGLDGTQTNAR